MSLVTRLVNGVLAFLKTVDPKVKLPAKVGTVIAIVLAVLPIVGADVPTLAPVIAIAVTVLTAVTGYIVPSK